MGRNNKSDLRYFQVDVGILRDTKVRRLARKFDRGVEFYLYILCAIYSDRGYYLQIDDQTTFDIADDLRIEEHEVDQMLDFCTSDSVGLFSRELREKYQILTSRGVQTRYIEVVKQLKRKVIISDQYSLLTKDERNDNTSFIPQKEEETAISSEQIIVDSQETAISSEQIGIDSEKTAISSTSWGISSDKSKEEESKVNKNKKEEIKIEENISISAEATSRKERENFLKILLFEKNLQDPAKELLRFEAHYEKTGWVDANGNLIRNRLAALKAWTPDKDAARLSLPSVRSWLNIYERMPGDRLPMLEHFRGMAREGDTLHIMAEDKALVVFMESNVGALRKVINRLFEAGLKVNYRVKN